METVIELPYDTAYDRGDNNNGITVVDITHLDRIAYCFVDYFGMESAAVPLHTPLTAWQYVHVYYDDHHPFIQNNLDGIKALESCPLVEMSTLLGEPVDPAMFSS